MVENTRMKELYETLKSHEQNFVNTGEMMSKIEPGLNELHQTLASVNQNIEYLLRKTNEAGTGSIAEMGDSKLQEKQKRKETVNYSVGFPDFDGSNPQEWLCQANQFFENYPDDEFAKVRHASFYLTGDADLWFIENFEGKERVTWHHFSSQLLGRFLMIEPIPSGNLSPGFDPSTCRNVFVGSVLEVTNCFPFPGREDDDETETDGANYQLEMMRCLREVNGDYSDQLGSTFSNTIERDGLRRSQSMISGKRETWHKKSTTELITASRNNYNDLHIRRTPVHEVKKESFVRDLLGAEEKSIAHEGVRIPFPGLSSAIQKLPIGNSLVIKGDVSKGMNSGRLHVLKPVREKNGVVPVLKDTSSPTNGSKVASSIVTSITRGPLINPVFDRFERKPVLTVLEKRPTSQAKSRNDFFNLLRKKSIPNTSSAIENSSSALESSVVGGTDGAVVVTDEKEVNGKEFDDSENLVTPVIEGKIGSGTMIIEENAIKDEGPENNNDSSASPEHLNDPVEALIGEEVVAKKLTLKNVTDHIADVVSERAELGYNYGVIFIPEGLIDFIPEVQQLIAELNEILAHEIVDEADEWKKKLTPQCHELFHLLPPAIQDQLMLERDPHGNVQVAKIETEKMLIQMVETELEVRKQGGTYKGNFKEQSHFFGYEGRCEFPSNFDSTYCYALGYAAGALLQSGKTGLISSVGNLDAPVTEWTVGGTALTSLMDIEVVEKSGLFGSESVGEKQSVWMIHGDEVVKLPPGFVVVARSIKNAAFEVNVIAIISKSAEGGSATHIWDPGGETLVQGSAEGQLAWRITTLRTRLFLRGRHCRVSCFVCRSWNKTDEAFLVKSLADFLEIFLVLCCLNQGHLSLAHDRTAEVNVVPSGGYKRNLFW